MRNIVITGSTDGLRLAAAHANLVDDTIGRIHAGSRKRAKAVGELSSRFIRSSGRPIKRRRDQSLRAG